MISGSDKYPCSGDGSPQPEEFARRWSIQREPSAAKPSSFTRADSAIERTPSLRSKASTETRISKGSISIPCASSPHIDTQISKFHTDLTTLIAQHTQKLSFWPVVKRHQLSENFVTACITLVSTYEDEVGDEGWRYAADRILWDKAFRASKKRGRGVNYEHGLRWKLVKHLNAVFREREWRELEDEVRWIKDVGETVEHLIDGVEKTLGTLTELKENDEKEFEVRWPEWVGEMEGWWTMLESEVEWMWDDDDDDDADRKGSE